MKNREQFLLMIHGFDKRIDSLKLNSSATSAGKNQKYTVSELKVMHHLYEYDFT